MSRKTDSGIALFLMELMITILMFSVCAAVSVSIFANARMMAEQNDDRSHAITELRNLANCYKAAEGNLEITAELYGGKADGEVVRAHFDENWKQTDSDGSYLLTLYAEPKKTEAVAEAVKEDGKLLGRIPVKTHVTGGASHE